MQIYKNQHKGFSSLNLDGILFPINDVNDELGQHYDNSIRIVPNDLKKILIKRNKNLESLNIKYLCVVIPDRSVMMSKYLNKYPGFSQCLRPYIESISDLSYVVDSLKDINQLCERYGCESSAPDHSFLNMLSIQGVCGSLISHLGVELEDYQVVMLLSNQMELDQRNLIPNNNNDLNLKIWNVPTIKIPNQKSLINRCMSKDNLKIVNLSVETLSLNENKNNYIDMYINLHCQNDLVVFIYHDDNLMSISNHKFVQKEYLASHFKVSYFLCGAYDDLILKKLPVTYVIEMQMEQSLNNCDLSDSLFDSDYYKQKYLDCGTDALKHFLDIGLLEGRFPNALMEIECQQRFKLNYQRLDNENPFDEAYYLKTNPDVQLALNQGILTSAQEHYNQNGQLEYRQPNELTYSYILQNMEPVDFSYLKSYKIVELFQNEFNLDVIQFYRKYGRYMGHIANNLSPFKQFNHKYLNQSDNFEEKLIINFDPKYYLDQYNGSILYPLYHYLNHGLKYEYSPNNWFNEKFYRNFYFEVKNKIINGEIKSGFHDYLTNNNQKISQFQLTKCLEHYYGGVTHPMRIDVANNLEYALNVPDFKIIESNDQRIWLMLESFNPDIFFGGYLTFMKFIDSLILNKYQIGIYLTSGHHDIINYYMYHHPHSLITRNIHEIPIRSATFSPKPLIFGEKDIFIAYSAWQVNHAHHFAQATGRRFIYFIQEYEAVFFPNDSLRFYVESCYRKPHFAMYHGDNLQSYFEQNRLGTFAQIPSNLHYTYNLVMCPNQIISKDDLINKKRRKLIFYARPEKHAERNLFEIGLIAIKRVVYQGYFKDWDFYGIGALNQYQIPVTEHIKMQVLAKTDQKTYCDLIRNADVGLSLIFSPHPGLVHFEMAMAGMIVVVNTFSTRPKEFYDKISPRLVASEPSLEDIMESLKKAEQLAYNDDLRLVPWNHNFANPESNPFSGDQLQQIFNKLNLSK